MARLSRAPLWRDPRIGLSLLAATLAVLGAMAGSATHVEAPALAGVVAVVLMAVPALVGTLRWLGRRRGAALLAGLSLYAYGIETVGAATGWPYGHFAYGGGLGPMLFDLVPVALPLAYVPLVLGAVAVATRAGAPVGGAAWLGLALATLLWSDLVLDPGAVALGYWSYAAGGAYYGVPWSNFGGWIVTGTAALAASGLQLRRAPGAPGPCMFGSMAMTVAFYTGVTAATGQVIPALLGAAGIAILAVGLSGDVPWAKHRPKLDTLLSSVYPLRQSGPVWPSEQDQEEA